MWPEAEREVADGLGSAEIEDVGLLEHR